MGLTVYYDIQEGIHVPIWMIARFGRGKIKWYKTYAYIPVTAPFKRKLAEEFNELTLSVSVQLDDLTIPPHRPGEFGINLQRILNRIRKNKDTCDMDLDDIEQFVIQMSDIEEVLQLAAARYYMP